MQISVLFSSAPRTPKRVAHRLNAATTPSCLFPETRSTPPAIPNASTGAEFRAHVVEGLEHTTRSPCAHVPAAPPGSFWVGATARATISNSTSVSSGASPSLSRRYMRNHGDRAGESLFQVLADHDRPATLTKIIGFALLGQFLRAKSRMTAGLNDSIRPPCCSSNGTDTSCTPASGGSSQHCLAGTGLPVRPESLHFAQAGRWVMPNPSPSAHLPPRHPAPGNRHGLPGWSSHRDRFNEIYRLRSACLRISERRRSEYCSSCPHRNTHPDPLRLRFCPRVNCAIRRVGLGISAHFINRQWIDKPMAPAGPYASAGKTTRARNGTSTLT